MSIEEENWTPVGKMLAWLSLPQPTVNEDNIVQHQNEDPRKKRGKGENGEKGENGDEDGE